MTPCPRCGRLPRIPRQYGRPLVCRTCIRKAVKADKKSRPLFVNKPKETR